MAFENFWICGSCGSRFLELPETECPVCVKIEEITELIKTMTTRKEYLRINSKINQMDTSINQFDLFIKLSELPTTYSENLS